MEPRHSSTIPWEGLLPGVAGPTASQNVQIVDQTSLRWNTDATVEVHPLVLGRWRRPPIDHNTTPSSS